MKRNVRYIVALVVIATTTVYLSACLGVSGARNGQIPCSGICVTVQDSLHHDFLTAKEIRSYILKALGDCTGEPVSGIRLDEIEARVDEMSAVLKSEAYLTRDGMLHVDARLRTPVLCLSGEGTRLYVDEEGYVFPVQRNEIEGVTMITGSIPVKLKAGYKGELTDSTERKWVNDVLEMTSWMRKNVKRWDGYGISVMKNGDMVLAPHGEKTQFIIGQPEGYLGKFRKIAAYYSKIEKAKGADTYGTVNVKFSGQIVCSK